MWFTALLAIAIFPSSGWANSQEEISSDCNASDAIIIPCLKGIVLIEEESDLERYAKKDIRGLEVFVDVPGGSENLNKMLSPFFDEPLTENSIKNVIQTISRYYLDNYRPMISVEVPAKQDITDCVLRLIVKESRVGSFSIVDKSCRSKAILSRYMKLQEGDRINERVILKDVDFINRNPFRRADVIYSSGEKPYTTDIVVNVNERRPFRCYAGADNTGVESTGTERWYTGFNTAYFFAFDAQLNYQFTASYDPHRFYSHTGQVQMMLPWQQVLNLYGGYSSVHAHVDFPGMGNHGESSQASLRYIIPLFPTRASRHEVSAGFDFKRTNNNLLFTEESTPFFGQTVNLTQIMGRYTGHWEGNKSHLDYDLEAYYSPGKWLPDQKNSNFESLRPGATNQWIYGRGAIGYLQQLPLQFWLDSQLRAQLASGALLPSEQLGIGGYDTVRGYDEREINKDNGLIFNLEIRTPRARFFSLIGCVNPSVKLKENLQFLGFFDYGIGKDNSINFPNPRTQYLMSVGPGVRYTFDPTIAVRVDYGFRLHNAAEFEGPKLGKLHFSATVSY